LGDRSKAEQQRRPEEARLMSKRRTYARFLTVFILIGGVGIAASVYTLVHQRLALPFSDTYTLRARFSAADGVVSGLGQPVNVVGVKVGQVTGASLQDGQALVTMQIDRHLLPSLYANARAVLEPITPLEDMQINLDPGTPATGPLPSSTTITVGQTGSPVQLSDLLSTLDTDTRDFLTSLIGSIGQGTSGRGVDIRRILDTLGPTTGAVAQISRALAARRGALAGLVHNLAIVTRAASRDRQLASVVAAGNQTLRAVAVQEAPLRQALVQLPPTLAVTRSTLVALEPFAKQLGPTLTSLAPAVKRLPAALRELEPFASEGTTALRNNIRPFVTAAQPLVRALLPAVGSLNATTPQLSRSFQVLEYLVNELAYNPDPSGNDRGFLFWLDWFAHNWDSATSFADANGGIGRAEVLANCYGLQGITQLQQLLGVVGLCPH
jgi:phospholipid/cholesterol/gamma-HCH transport system substrate-binding protein